MREIRIPNTEYTVLVAPNGHLWVYLKEAPFGHINIQLNKNMSDEKIIDIVKHCFTIKA